MNTPELLTITELNVSDNTNAKSNQKGSQMTNAANQNNAKKYQKENKISEFDLYNGKLLQTGNENDAALARENFVNKYRKMAENYANKLYRSNSVFILDYVEADANIGLLEAIKRYDPQIGTFEYYAKIWIYNIVHKSFPEIINPGVPKDVVKVLKSFRKTEREYCAEFGGKPTVHDVCQFGGLDEDEVRKAFSCCPKTVFFEDKASFSSCDDEYDSDYWYPESKNSDDANPCEIAAERESGKNNNAFLAAALKNLSERDRNIVLWRNGIDVDKTELKSNGSLSFKEIGRRLGLSDERVRQIYNIKIKELRKYAESSAALFGLNV